MGNSNKNPEKLEDFYMHIQLIGKNMTKFLALISGKAIPSKAKQHPEERKKIEDFWDFDYSKDKEIKEQIDEYYQHLLNLKNKNEPDKIKETLVFKVDNSFDITIEYIFEKLNGLREDYCMPILLFLVVDGKKEITYDKKKYPKIKANLIISKKYSENPLYYKDEGYMKYLFIRFCSIHNELGDCFSIGEGKNVIDYDLIQQYFPFNLNLCCVGRFGQGKSTGVNVLLNEYKAKESSQGSAQTKHLTFYQVTNAPIRILDIPGFDSEENVNLAIDKLRICSSEINKLKDYIHFFLYFITGTEKRIFSQYECPIIEEIIKYKDSKVIYVVTHSDNEDEEEEKAEFINKINQGINGLKDIDDEKKKLVKQMMNASKQNVVFVNFYKEKKKEAFGKKDLFQKIHDFFIESKFFKEASKNLNPEEVEKQASILKERANSILTWNKVGGSLIGLVPGIDWIVQKFVVKKKIAKKIGEVFGISVNFINEQNEISKKKTTMTIPGTDNEDENIYAGTSLNLEVDGDNLISDSGIYKIGNSFKVAGDAGGMIGGGVSLGIGISRSLTQVASGAGEAAANGAIIAGTSTLKVIGSVCFILGAVVGVGTGCYFTCKHCREMIDFFEKFYKENASKICNSYFYAVNYLISNTK